MTSYAVTTQVSVSTAADLVRITPPPGTSLKLLECHVTNDQFDNQEQLPFAIYRASTNGGGGSAVTAVPLDPSDPAYLGSVAALLTSIATKEAQLDRQGVPAAGGYHYMPMKKSRPVIADNRRFVCRLEAAPSTTMELTITMVVQVNG